MKQFDQMNQANQMNQLKQVNQMNQVKQENLVDLAIQAKLKFHLKNNFIQTRFIFAPLQTDPNLHSVFSG